MSLSDTAGIESRSPVARNMDVNSLTCVLLTDINVYSGITLTENARYEEWDKLSGFLRP